MSLYKYIFIYIDIYNNYNNYYPASGLAPAHQAHQSISRLALRLLTSRVDNVKLYSPQMEPI